jgi:hypothetical protein
LCLAVEKIVVGKAALDMAAEIVEKYLGLP